MIKNLILTACLVGLCLGSLAVGFPQEEKAPELTLEDAREFSKEIDALRSKLEVYFAELSRMQAEYPTADADRKKELETEQMLKQRAYSRMGETLMTKASQVVSITTKLIDGGEDSLELRKMRMKTAYDLKVYGLVIRDAGVIPDDEKDTHMKTIWAHSLNNVCNYKEAAKQYEAVLPHMKQDEQPFIRMRLATCYFNAHQFDKARIAFSELADLAPQAQKPDFSRQAMIANQHVRLWEKELELRDEDAAKEQNPIVVLQVTKGNIELELFEDNAPNTVANFITLVESGFYDGLLFYQVLPQIMIQSGCPKNTGKGGPGYKIADECRQANSRRHFVGSLSTYKTTKAVNSNGSQFFIGTGVAWWLDGQSTVFGRVLRGQEVVNQTTQGDRIISAKVMFKRDHDYEVEKL